MRWSTVLFKAGFVTAIVLMATESLDAQVLLGTCQANALTVNVYKGGPHCRRLADTAWIGGITCQNDCDTCCQFYLDITNDSKCQPIVEAQLCVEPGWCQTPPGPCQLRTDPFAIAHICSWCDSYRRLDSVSWIEADTTDTTRLFPEPGDTVVDDWGRRDRLCLNNCMHIAAAVYDTTADTIVPDFSRGVMPGQTLRNDIGISGARCDTTTGYCIHVWVKWADGATSCCDVGVRRCFPCLPRPRCWQTKYGVYCVEGPCADTSAMCQAWESLRAQWASDSLGCPGKPGPELSLERSNLNASDDLVLISEMVEATTARVTVVGERGLEFSGYTTVSSGRTEVPSAKMDLPPGTYTLDVALPCNARKFSFVVR